MDLYVTTVSTASQIPYYTLICSSDANLASTTKTTVKENANSSHLNHVQRTVIIDHCPIKRQ